VQVQLNRWARTSQVPGQPLQRPGQHPQRQFNAPFRTAWGGTKQAGGSKRMALSVCRSCVGPSKKSKICDAISLRRDEEEDQLNRKRRIRDMQRGIREHCTEAAARWVSPGRYNRQAVGRARYLAGDVTHYSRFPDATILTPGQLIEEPASSEFGEEECGQRTGKEQGRLGLDLEKTYRPPSAVRASGKRRIKVVAHKLKGISTKTGAKGTIRCRAEVSSLHNDRCIA
jgi:hypothetical protein